MIKKIFICFIITLLIFSVSCKEENGVENVSNTVYETDSEKSPESDTEFDISNESALDSGAVTGLEHHVSTGFRLPSHNWFVVEWGEQIELQTCDNDNENKYIGVAVNFLKSFECTYFGERNISQERQRRMKFVNEKSQTYIAEKYDDIIIVSNVIADQIPDGGTALVTLFSNFIPNKSNELVAFWEIGSENETVLWAYPISQNTIVIPDHLSPIKNNGSVYGFSDFLTWSLGQANEYLTELGLTDNLFRDGMTLEELGAYFELVTDPNTFAPLFKE